MIMKSKNKHFTNTKIISIKYIGINKIVASNKVSFGKKGFKCFIGYKNAKKLSLYGYFSKNERI